MKLTGGREKTEREMDIRICFFLICSVDFVQNVVSDASGAGYTQHGQVSQLHQQPL